MRLHRICIQVPFGNEVPEAWGYNPIREQCRRNLRMAP